MDGIDKNIFEECQKRFTKTFDYYSNEFTEGDEDVDFALGEQWPEEELSRRRDDHRPALTENHCMPFVDQVVNNAREMKPRVKVAPVDDKGDTDTAEVYKGAIRNIERQSKASHAYDMAVQNAVMAKIGWIRVNTAYVSPMSFDQKAVIEAVADWKSVMLDPASTEPDGSDAEFGFIYKDIEKEAFQAEYPDRTPLSFEDPEGEGKDEKIRLVEYYYKKYEETEIFECYLADNTIRILTKSEKEEIENQGFFIQELQSRKTKIPTVKWCKMDGNGVIEKTDWLGKYIPLVPVYGKLVWHKDRLKSYSLIKHAKDPQRMLNIIKTTIAEIVGSQPKNQPYIGATGQFDSDGRWQNANQENYSSLEYDPVFVTDEVSGQSALAPPPQKSPPLQVPPALFQIEANAAMGMSKALGMYEENRGNESNAISGVAIQSRQIRGDKSTFHFIDNLACSIRHVGVILVDLIPKIYNQKQILRIIGDDDIEKTVTVDPTAETNKAEGIYNLGAGEYDVDVDVGPSYANQQQEFLDISKDLLTANPEYASVAADKIIEAAGGPYADVIAERIRANNPLLQTDDPMAVKLMETVKQLDGMKAEQEQLLIALDEKKKNEAEELQIKRDEVKIKAQDAETKRIETLAKIQEMKLKAEGAEAEALADFADAIMDMDAQSQEVRQVLPIIMDKLEQLDAAMQATGQPIQ